MTALLKLFACIMMLIDHIGYYYASVLPETTTFMFRTAGRLAMPVFAWYIARGFKRTRNQFLYFARIAGFAVVSEVLLRSVHSWASLNWNSMNILVTFTLGIVFIAGYNLAVHSYFDMIASLRPVPSAGGSAMKAPRYDVRINIGGLELDPRAGLALGSIMIIASTMATIWLKPDYSLYGILTVAIFYIVQDQVRDEDHEKRSIQLFILLNALFMLYRIIVSEVPFEWALLQCFSVLAVPLCYRISEGRRPSWPVKYAFYIFYPVHIILLVIIRTLIM